MEWLFNLGVKSGMPRYVSLIILIQIGILFIPEFTWSSLGIDSPSYIDRFPVFVQHWVHNTSFNNAMMIFWALSPFSFSIITVLYLLHINCHDYNAYLVRRKSRLDRQKKNSDYTLIVGGLLLVIAYIWITVFRLEEPHILGYSPSNYRILMSLYHGGVITLMLPAAITVVITELRTNFFRSEPIDGVDQANAVTDVEVPEIFSTGMHGINRYIASGIAILGIGLIFTKWRLIGFSGLFLGCAVGLIGESVYIWRVGEVNVTLYISSITYNRNETPVHFYFHLVAFGLLGLFCLVLSSLMLL